MTDKRSSIRFPEAGGRRAGGYKLKATDKAGGCPRVRRRSAPPLAREDDFSRDVAGAWAALSPWKREVGIAVRNWRIAVGAGLDPVLCYYAIATFAAQACDDRHPGAPYHAVSFTERTARTYVAAIREILQQAEQPSRMVKVVGGAGAFQDLAVRLGA